MSRSGNQNLKGQVRAEIVAGPDVQFIAGTSSGLFASIDRNGVGNYQALVNPGTPLDSTNDTTPVDGQIEGATRGLITTSLTNDTTLEIRTFIENGAGAPIATDLGFSLRVWERFLG